MGDIDEKTKIPLFAVIGALLIGGPVLVGGIYWLSSIDQKASASQQELNGLKPMVKDIEDRVIRIEQHQLDEATHR